MNERYDKESSPELNWQDEARGVINDIKDLTKHAELSTIPSSGQHIFINITTLEDKAFCIELTALGFRIAGYQHDSLESTREDYYETPYALLSKISAAYHNQFAKNLINKLENLYDNK